MLVTQAIIKKVRRHLNEPDETRFTDDDITDLLDDYPSINKAISVGWTMKAGKLQQEMGNIEEYSTGNERYKYQSLTNLLNAALKMADKYEELYQEEQNSDSSSLILKFNTPDVM
ncbi:hypothetical protein [Rummeliibacillus sp. POC4]|uniref:hypothetical protein n=1 Tax=Rummeliibacillus sp. POC4 TaxID=2305899 RepID=UPI000E673096|nr:hypothetical protein [Rummeliibacillus sp. POC4]RIJ63610.1 hypothetical protein D1606_14110 [Rummeliibacillus sp. POC4]